MPGQDGVDDLRNDRFVVADDAGEQRPPFGEAAHEVLPHLEPDAAAGQATGVDRLTKLSQTFR